MKYTKTHCKNGHEWNNENTAWSTNGNYCKVCAKESRDRQPAIWRQRDRKRYFDAVIPVWKACAAIMGEATS